MGQTNISSIKEMKKEIKQWPQHFDICCDGGLEPRPEVNLLLWPRLFPQST